ncbi:MAG: FAH family protein, partial [Asticcacaulis sp.]|nr:FAH family protein [Asticcacaulis sp.]
MALRLIHIMSADGERKLVAVTGAGAQCVNNVSSTYELARAAIAAGRSLADQVAFLGLGEAVDVEVALTEGRVLAPIDHPDPAHLHVTGTGLTHLGSAEGRDKMHKAAAAAETQTDSMRMFLMGVAGGKPAKGEVGAQPEWFYKGNGHSLVGPNAPLTSPA